MHFIWKYPPSSIHNAFYNCLYLLATAIIWSQLISAHLLQLLLKQCPEINIGKLFLLHSSKVMSQCVQKLLFFDSTVLFRILKRNLSTLTNDTAMSYSLSPSAAVLFKVYHALNIDMFVRMQSLKGFEEVQVLQAFYLVFLCCLQFVLVCWYPRKPLKVKFVSWELTVILNIEKISVLKIC